MYQEIFIVEDNERLITKLKKIFETEKDYVFNRISSNKISDEIKTIPDLIIIDEDNISEDIIETCNYIRNYSENSITPIMVISSNVDKEHIDVELTKKMADLGLLGMCVPKEYGGQQLDTLSYIIAVEELAIHIYFHEDKCKQGPSPQLDE